MKPSWNLIIIWSFLNQLPLKSCLGWSFGNWFKVKSIFFVFDAEGNRIWSYVLDAIHKLPQFRGKVMGR